MLLAHITPAYGLVRLSQPWWNESWTPLQRGVLWTAAFASTVAPDSDVIYNLLFRGFMNHSILWTHSLFPYLAFGVVWLILCLTNLFPYGRVLLGLVVCGGLSHLFLDIIAHNTPIFYPLSTEMIGNAPNRIMHGGLRQYITSPLFLLEPYFLSLVVAHWVYVQKWEQVLKDLALGVIMVGGIIFTVGFLVFLPDLQAWADGV